MASRLKQFIIIVLKAKNNPAYSVVKHSVTRSIDEL
jgi:hypothetical protein